MENNPFYADQEEDQSTGLIELLSNEIVEKEEDQEETSSKKKKKKFQTYFKDIFKKFLISDSDIKKDHEFGIDLNQNSELFPIISIDKIEDTQGLSAAEKEEKESTVIDIDSTEISKSEPELDKEENQDISKHTLSESEQLASIPEEIDYAERDDESLVHAVKQYNLDRDRTAFPEDYHQKNNTYHDAEPVGKVMLQNIEKKRIKELEKDVAKAKNNLRSIDKKKKNRTHHQTDRFHVPNHQERKNTSQKPEDNGFFMKEASHNNKTRHEKKELRKNDNETVDNIREKIEKQYKKFEKEIEGRIPEILKTNEYATLDILDRRQPIYETYQEKYGSVLGRAAEAPKISIEGELFNNNYSRAITQTEKKRSLGLINDALPRNYRQAVTFGATYGLIFFCVLLLLIALRLI